MNKDDIAQIDRNFGIISILTAIVLTAGVAFYHFVEHLRIVDAIYFCVITLTTVGYGDIAPKTDIGKLFTAGYVIAGVAIIATFANLLIKRAVVKRQYKSNSDS